MNSLFNIVNNLFESETPVTLTERGHKYIQKLPDDKAENRGSDWSIDYVDTETGEKVSKSNIKNISKTRSLFDVIKHLAPTGYHFNIGSRGYDGIVVNLVKDSSNNSYTFGYIKIDINADDNVKATFKLDPRGVAASGIFNREVTIKDVAQELAKEKGAQLDDEFMIDNGAEIKAKYQELKSTSTGTAEELASKVEAQLNKLPQGVLLKLKESAKPERTSMETIINEAKKADSSKLVEDYDPSMPNWLKRTAIKGRNDWKAPTIDSNTQFKILSKDELKNITKIAKEADANGQILFIRLGNSAYWYDDRRWRQCLDYYNQRSEADMMNAISREDNKASGCITTNYTATRNSNKSKATDRDKAREGGVYRKDEVGSKSSYWDDEYDKSGYKLDPHKYERMLRDIKKEKLANSEVLTDIENGNYVERFNELGKQAAEFIKDNLNISYKDSSYSYSDHYNMNKSVIQTIEKNASEASRAIYELMARISYIKNGDGSRMRGDKPGTDVEGWLKDQADRVETALKNFQEAITKAEDTVE